jgi:ribonuclease Z
VGAGPNEDFPLKPNLLIRTFPTVHRVPSHGYSVYRRIRKLRKDLEGRSTEEIGAVRMKGEEVTEERLQLLVSFTGDTQIEFLDLSPEVRHSKILMLEATYLDEQKPISSAKEWGHTHLDEIIPRLETITSEKIVLFHTSARYPIEEAHRLLKKRLPPHELERVLIYPGR